MRLTPVAASALSPPETRLLEPRTVGVQLVSDIGVDLVVDKQSAERPERRPCDRARTRRGCPRVGGSDVLWSLIVDEYASEVWVDGWLEKMKRGVRRFFFI